MIPMSNKVMKPLSDCRRLINIAIANGFNFGNNKYFFSYLPAGVRLQSIVWFASILLRKMVQVGGW